MRRRAILLIISAAVAGASTRTTPNASAVHCEYDVPASRRRRCRHAAARRVQPTRRARRSARVAGRLPRRSDLCWDIYFLPQLCCNSFATVLRLCIFQYVYATALPL